MFLVNGTPFIFPILYIEVRVLDMHLRFFIQKMFLKKIIEIYFIIALQRKKKFKKMRETEEYHVRRDINLQGIIRT